MLRIPLPEDDGFALALPEKPRGRGRVQTRVSEARSLVKCHTPLPMMNDTFLLHGAPPSEDSQQATIRRAK